MRRATITLPDDLEALLERYLDRLDAPPSLTALVQAALRQYLEDALPRDPRPSTATRGSSVGEKDEYDAEGGVAAWALDPETELALRQAATREGVSPIELAHSILRDHVRSQKRPAPKGLGEYRSGRSDVSSRAEEILRRAAKLSR